MRSQKQKRKKNPRIRNQKQQRNIMRKQQKCVYVRFFSPSNIFFFSLCARSVKSRDLLRQLRHSPPAVPPPRPAHVLHNGCGDGTCKSGEQGDYFCPMSACSYKYYVYAVADAAQREENCRKWNYLQFICEAFVYYNFYRFTSVTPCLPLGWSCWFCSQTSTCPSRWR